MGCYGMTLRAAKTPKQRGRIPGHGSEALACRVSDQRCRLNVGKKEDGKRAENTRMCEFGR